MERQNGLITGGTGGIGLHTARELTWRGMYIILVGHDQGHGAPWITRRGEGSDAGTPGS